MNRKTLLDVAKYLLAIVLLGWVGYKNWDPPLPADAPADAESHGLRYVWDRHVVHGEPINTGYLITGFVVLCGAMALTMLRWYLLVRALDLKLSLRDAFRYGMVGVFFNTFLPGSVGGDLVKAAVLARGQARRTAAVATVIMDRLVALWALVWFVAILGSIFWLCGMLDGDAKSVSTSIIAGALITVAVTLTIWMLIGLLPDERAERFAGRLQKLRFVGGPAAEMWRSAWMYRRRQKSVALVMGLSWIGHVGFVVAFYCCAMSLWSGKPGTVPSLTQHFLLVPIGLVMQAIIPTPGGAGAGEWGFGALYSLFGAAPACGVLGSLVQRVFTGVLGLVGYVVYLLGPATAKAPGTQEVPSTATAPQAAAAG